MVKKHKKIPNKIFYFAVFRYMFILALVLTNFLSLFLPFLTIKVSYFIINIFTSATLYGNIIYFQEQAVEIVSACVAISAYYFLLILNFSVPMPPKKRIYALLYSFTALFMINILRIVIFSFILLASKELFKTMHFIFWFGLSSIIVVLIWFSEAKIFKIKEIPVYSDIKLFLKAIKN
jgi:exosortase/archaeosortase family protein